MKLSKSSGHSNDLGSPQPFERIAENPHIINDKYLFYERAKGDTAHEGEFQGHVKTI